MNDRDTSAAGKLRADALELANCQPGDELTELAGLIERFRLEYSTRLSQHQINDLERAESYARTLSGEDEELRQEREYRCGECRTCGEIIGSDGRCLCWAHFASALEQYMGYGFDNAAQQASEMWETMSGEAREFVWSGGWLDERAWCPYCGDWQRGNRDPAIHHPECEGSATLRAERQARALTGHELAERIDRLANEIDSDAYDRLAVLAEASRRLSGKAPVR